MHSFHWQLLPLLPPTAYRIEARPQAASRSAAKSTRPSRTVMRHEDHARRSLSTLSSKRVLSGAKTVGLMSALLTRPSMVSLLRSSVYLASLLSTGGFPFRETALGARRRDSSHLEVIRTTSTAASTDSDIARIMCSAKLIQSPADCSM